MFQVSWSISISRIIVRTFRVVTWTLEHWKSKDKNVSTGDFVKKCYAWIKDVTQAEEVAICSNGNMIRLDRLILVSNFPLFDTYYS